MFYFSLNHQNFFAAVNNIILEDDCGNLYISLPVQLAWYLRAELPFQLAFCSHNPITYTFCHVMLSAIQHPH